MRLPRLLSARSIFGSTSSCERRAVAVSSAAPTAQASAIHPPGAGAAGRAPRRPAPDRAIPPCPLYLYPLYPLYRAGGRRGHKRTREAATSAPGKPSARGALLRTGTDLTFGKGTEMHDRRTRG